MRQPSTNPYREGGRSSVAGCFAAPYQGLSPVRGNLHAGFLGEGWAVRPAPYPTTGLRVALHGRQRLKCPGPDAACDRHERVGGSSTCWSGSPEGQECRAVSFGQRNTVSSRHRARFVVPGRPTPVGRWQTGDGRNSVANALKRSVPGLDGCEVQSILPRHPSPTQRSHETSLRFE